jgi:molybdenum cofactor biosynthesis enzyme MoaA
VARRRHKVPRIRDSGRIADPGYFMSPMSHNAFSASNFRRRFTTTGSFNGALVLTDGVTLRDKSRLVVTEKKEPEKKKKRVGALEGALSIPDLISALTNRYNKESDVKESKD